LGKFERIEPWLYKLIIHSYSIIVFRWVIFNDEKVAESESPPKDLAYIYFYRRILE